MQILSIAWALAADVKRFTRDNNLEIVLANEPGSGWIQAWQDALFTSIKTYIKLKLAGCDTILYVERDAPQGPSPFTFSDASRSNSAGADGVRFGVRSTGPGVRADALSGGNGGTALFGAAGGYVNGGGPGLGAFGGGGGSGAVPWGAPDPEGGADGEMFDAGLGASEEQRNALEGMPDADLGHAM